MAKRRSGKQRRSGPGSYETAKRLIELAKAENCTHLKVGTFEVDFSKDETPNTHAIGFEVSPTDDSWLSE